MQHGKTPGITDCAKTTPAYQGEPAGCKTVGIGHDFVRAFGVGISFVETLIRILIGQRRHRKSGEQQAGQNKTQKDSTDNAPDALGDKPKIDRLFCKLHGQCLKDREGQDEQQRKTQRLRPGDNGGISAVAAPADKEFRQLLEEAESDYACTNRDYYRGERFKDSAFEILISAAT